MLVFCTFLNSNTKFSQANWLMKSNSFNIFPLSRRCWCYLFPKLVSTPQPIQMEQLFSWALVVSPDQQAKLNKMNCSIKYSKRTVD